MSGPADEFVVVFEAHDAGLLAVAESLLESADIRFFLQNEARAITGIAGYGPVRIAVANSDADAARAALGELGEPSAPPAELNELPDELSAPGEEPALPAPETPRSTAPVEIASRDAFVDGLRGIVVAGLVFDLAHCVAHHPWADDLARRAGTLAIDDARLLNADSILGYPVFLVVSAFLVGWGITTLRIRGLTRVAWARVLWLGVVGLLWSVLVEPGNLILYASLLAVALLVIPIRISSDLLFAVGVLGIGAFLQSSLHNDLIPIYADWMSTETVARETMILRTGGFSANAALRYDYTRRIIVYLVYEGPYLAAAIAGGWAARSGALSSSGGRPRVAKLTYFVLPIAIAACALHLGYLSGSLEEPSPYILDYMLHDFLLYAVAPISTGAVYIALAARASMHPALSRALSIFQPLGQMPLTSYLSVSLFASLLFAGYGGRLFDELDHASAFLVGAASVVVVLVGSHVCLRRFRRGPAEALLRQATY